MTTGTGFKFHRALHRALLAERKNGMTEIETLRAEVERLTALGSDYEEVLADKRRLTRELDVAMHGEDGAAKQASMCDLIEPAKNLRTRAEKAEAALGKMRADTERLDELHLQSWDLRCFPIPTGGDDADIGWRVVGHWMAEPQERVVGEVFTDDPRAAIDAAIRASLTEGE